MMKRPSLFTIGVHIPVKPCLSQKPERNPFLLLRGRAALSSKINLSHQCKLCYSRIYSGFALYAVRWRVGETFVALPSRLSPRLHASSPPNLAWFVQRLEHGQNSSLNPC